jgi:hypothetical protein
MTFRRCSPADSAVGHSAPPGRPLGVTRKENTFAPLGKEGGRVLSAIGRFRAALRHGQASRGALRGLDRCHPQDKKTSSHLLGERRVQGERIDKESVRD